jgi:hypothetical protein
MCAGQSAEGASDFLLELDHADVPFRQVVIEGDVKINRNYSGIGQLKDKSYRVQR